MQMVKKLAAVLLAAVMSLAVLTACDITNGQGLFVDEVNKSTKIQFTHDPALDAEAEAVAASATSFYKKDANKKKSAEDVVATAENISEVYSGADWTAIIKGKSEASPFFVKGSNTYEQAAAAASVINTMGEAEDGCTYTMGYYQTTIGDVTGAVVTVRRTQK